MKNPTSHLNMRVHGAVGVEFVFGLHLFGRQENPGVIGLGIDWPAGAGDHHFRML